MTPCGVKHDERPGDVCLDVGIRAVITKRDGYQRGQVKNFLTSIHRSIDTR